jgi:hypothetical protein
MLEERPTTALIMAGRFFHRRELQRRLAREDGWKPLGEGGRTA